MILTKQDSGRTVTMSIGDTFSIQLKENPTTGYRWALEEIEGIKLVQDDFKSSNNGIGSSGLRIFQLRTTKDGVYEIYIKNWQEWSGEASIVDRFYITIHVS
ncbi:protease inhibitor I42 family protein [Bacillus cereus]|uniref:protease inhibitor I42 family protein n=1 Tax=Bacillus cereus TaxID=1396 RepID=UPI00046ECBF4|nr:protease inhibitor I42 family protein [Bacillus cereus]MDA2440202.1 protease inhibitor I42 family protein [Bacillus cereus]MDA2446332.1 protease inhibitor I42 family protein [Bacillus cereus]MDA2705108.1 protease inhibitor I42 family protein [Bacillus cereus]MDA2710775.1 protease inhibitor I42 family protein [Bacillus cereus]HDR6218685.1 protease inhibitor I42 family protein [Bacillus cereus]